MGQCLWKVVSWNWEKMVEWSSVLSREKQN